MIRYCRLCGEKLTSENKVQSHALTRATFFAPQKEIRPNSNHLEIYSKDKRFRDAGHYMTEYAFCKKCETKFSVWEQERNRLFKNSKRPVGTFTEKQYISETGYENEFIRLSFVLDLYRCSVFESEPYSKIFLGDYHSERIKNILLKGCFESTSDYPAILARYNNDYPLVNEISEMPQKMRMVDGVNVYRCFAPNGWTWFVKIDSRRHELFEKTSFVGGEIRILNLGSFKDSEDLMGIYRIVKQYS